VVHCRKGHFGVRILKVVQAYYPFQEKGGPTVKVRALAKGLVCRGNEITVLTANLGIEKKTDLMAETCQWGWRWAENGVEAIYLNTLSNYRALTFNPSLIQFSKSCVSHFDVVHFYGLYDLLGPAVSYFCRRQGVPYVIEPMGMYRPIDRNIRMKHLWHRSVGNRFWNDATQIVATSELEQQELLEDGVPGGKLVMRYNGVDMTSSSAPPRGAFRSKWGIPPEEPLILFLSRLIPRKGADILIEAFAETCKQSGRLVIAGPEGEPGYRGHLEKCAEKCGVGPRVIFTGPIYDDEKTALLADSDIFALPSRYENFANVAAEAIAFGVPVIITHSCGIRSVVDGHAGLVIHPDKAALADALRRMIDDKALYARLKEGCRRVADQLDWNRLTEQMESYYADVLARNNGVH
jgi:glycosyltransferase involved in cell wall biosynthesis